MRLRVMTVLQATAALLLAAALAGSGAPAQAKEPKASHAKGSHGAIAVNRESRAVGYAYDFKTAQDAKREALRQCVEKKCEVVATFRGGCAAVAANAKQLASATGVTRDEAETKATRKCGKECAVLAWACTKEK